MVWAIVISITLLYMFLGMIVSALNMYLENRIKQNGEDALCFAFWPFVLIVWVIYFIVSRLLRLSQLIARSLLGQAKD